MRPIPKNLLIHSVKICRKKSEDRWGKETVDEGTELKYVRLEPSSKVVRDKNHAEVQLAAVLFYDFHNSRPKDFSFLVDDVVTFNGQRFAVSLIEPLYDGRKLHHYELGLIKHA